MNLCLNLRTRNSLFKWPKLVSKKIIELFTFLDFGGVWHQQTLFSQENAKMGVQKPSFFGQSLSQEIFSYFSPFAFLESLTLLWDFCPLFSCFVPFSSYSSSSFQTSSNLRRFEKVWEGLNNKCRTWSWERESRQVWKVWKVWKGLNGLKGLKRFEDFSNLWNLSNLSALPFPSPSSTTIIQTFANRIQTFPNLFKPFEFFWGAPGGGVAREILGTPRGLKGLNPFQTFSNTLSFENVWKGFDRIQTFQTFWVSESLPGHPTRGPKKGLKRFETFSNLFRPFSRRQGGPDILGTPKGLKGLKGLNPFQTFSNLLETFQTLWVFEKVWKGLNRIQTFRNFQTFQTFQTFQVSENLPGHPAEGPKKGLKSLNRSQTLSNLFIPWDFQAFSNLFGGPRRRNDVWKGFETRLKPVQSSIV